MVYICKFAENVSQTAKVRHVYFLLYFAFEWPVLVKQHRIFTCRQNKHTHRHLVEAENVISNCENHTALYCTFVIQLLLLDENCKVGTEWTINFLPLPKCCFIDVVLSFSYCRYLFNLYNKGIISKAFIFAPITLAMVKIPCLASID